MSRRAPRFDAEPAPFIGRWLQWLGLAGLVVLASLPARMASAGVDDVATRVASGARLGAGGAVAPSPVEELGEIERRLLAQALEKHGLRIATRAEGREIGELIVEPRDVFLPESIWPMWFNWFHWTTRREVIVRRTTLQPGDPFSWPALDDARRYLLSGVNFSTVIIVPVEPRDDGQPGTGGVSAGDDDRERPVDLLVVTRDVWSLRLNSDFQTTGDTLNFLAFSLSETNFLGYDKHVAASFLLELDQWSLGPTYVDPQLFGTRLELDTRVRFAVNRDSGEFEGAFGSVTLSSPLVTLATEWGWSIQTVFSHLVQRRFSSGELLRFPLDAEEGDPTVPWVYRQRSVDTAATLTRSVVRDPTAVQHNISWGWRLLVVEPGVDPPDDLPPQIAEELAADFERRALPRSRRDSYPFVRYRTFEPDYHSYRDLETLELREEVRLGHDVSATVGVGSPLLGSLEPIVVPSASAAWRGAPLDDDLVTVSAGASTRMEGGDWIDSVVQGGLRYSTVLLGIGRLHLAGRITMRFEDPDNTLTALGGESALRGFPSNFFLGSNLVGANVEYRTQAIEILSTWFGLAAFWDGGSVFDQTDFGDLRWHNGVGLGLRWLIPQFNRTVLRLDWGFPLDTISPFPGTPSVAFEQAF